MKRFNFYVSAIVDGTVSVYAEDAADAEAQMNDMNGNEMLREAGIDIEATLDYYSIEDEDGEELTPEEIEWLAEENEDANL